MGISADEGTGRAARQHGAECHTKCVTLNGMDCQLSRSRAAPQSPQTRGCHAPILRCVAEANPERSGGAAVLFNNRNEGNPMGVKIDERTTTTIDRVTVDGYNASIEIEPTTDPTYRWMVRSYNGGSKLSTVQQQTDRDLREFAHALLRLVGDE